MKSLALILFWLPVGLMFYSYLFYPVLLMVFSAGKKENELCFETGDEQMPDVFILFSVFNEEKVIEEKLNSIFNTSFPLQKLKVYAGSDNSTDRSNEILSNCALKYPQLTFVPFNERSGKSGVLNKLMTLVEEGMKDPKKTVLIFTDANVMFSPDTLYELVKHFKNENISQVGANIMNKGVQADGISFQEKTYIRGENALKYLEGLNWGAMMGAFGACYALRADCWLKIPANQLMEDFYLSMYVLDLGKGAISEPKAVCYEDVSNEVGQEFKRKSRIQAGNFQNLRIYWKLLFRFNAVAFCFFSHKLIRWMGPLLIILAWLSNLYLLHCGALYVLTFVAQNILLLSPVIDLVLKSVGFHSKVLRFASYFYFMNLALAYGFRIYLKGVNTNAWEPTKRNV